MDTEPNQRGKDVYGVAPFGAGYPENTPPPRRSKILHSPEALIRLLSRTRHLACPIRYQEGEQEYRGYKSESEQKIIDELDVLRLSLA